MTLTAGARIGPYEVSALVGSGTTGDVYRARDPRLGRDVAIKVMGAAYREDPERFRTETSAAVALAHPNLVVIHDVGDLDGAPYVVCELLDGSTLRARLREGTTDRDAALRIAIQIGHGLGAAHGAGLVHGALRPANVMLLRDGRVKVLGLGEARAAAANTDGTVTATGMTGAGIEYLAPEQARGKPPDARADVFALGTILDEMLAAARVGDAATDAIIERCLAEDPVDRYQSARDLAFALEALIAGNRRPARSKLPRAAIAGIVLASLAGAATVVALERHAPAAEVASVSSAPQLHPLTSRAGVVRSARFTRDHDIVYAAAWNGGATNVYVMQSGQPESRELFANAEVLAVSPQNELALSLRPTRLHNSSGLRSGTLARAQLRGGAPREVATDVLSADWLPDGELVAVRLVNGDTGVVEWPLGTEVYRREHHLISHVRVSPDGSRVAFVEYTRWIYGEIVVIDRAHTVTKIPGPLEDLVDGLAWDPRSNELWFAGGLGGRDRCVYATTLAGEQRLVQCATGELALHDLDPGGRALIASARRDERIRVAGAPGTPERELAFGASDTLYDATPDGKRIVFGAPIAGSPVYIADLPDAVPVQIGTGYARGGISPDGAWVATDRNTQKPGESEPVWRRWFTPTGPGEERERTRIVDGERIGTASAGGGWARDGKTFYTPCQSATTGMDTCAYGLDGNGRRLYRGKQPLLSLRGVSPDGKHLLGRDVASKELELLATDGSGVQRLPASVALDEETAEVIGWAADGKSVLVRSHAWAPKLTVQSIDLTTGAAKPVRTLGPDDTAGELAIPSAFATTTGFVYSYHRTLSDLYLLEAPP